MRVDGISNDIPVTGYLPDARTSHPFGHRFLSDGDKLVSHIKSSSCPSIVSGPGMRSFTLLLSALVVARAAPQLFTRTETPVSALELAALAPYTQFARAAYCPIRSLPDWKCGRMLECPIFLI